MNNWDPTATWHYHDATKHPENLFATYRHALDPRIMPLPYKIYTTLDPIPLDTDFAPSDPPALDAIGAAAGAPGQRAPDLATLARILFFTDGITRRLHRGGQVFAFRAAPCTGALYHIELYLVCGDLPDLAAGVYHFGVHDNGLRQLRAGDYRRVLIEATGRNPAIAQAPVVMVCTSTYWRNSWKYRARAYRHTFWDTGTMLPNTLAVAAASGLPAEVAVGFADDPVSRLLDVDRNREAAVALVPLGRTPGEAPSSPPVQPLGLPTQPLSSREVGEPEIRAMHAATSLTSGEEAASWRGLPPPRSLPVPTGALTPLPPVDAESTSDDAIETVIRRRGSTRRFTLGPISLAELSTMLRLATRRIAADCFEPSGVPLSDAYLIVNAVGGLEPGAYVYHHDRQALELLTAGDFRVPAGHLALDQELAAEAAVNVYFLTDLPPILARFGNRGYRAAQLGPAIAAGRMWLASYALGLGATGLTFYDDVVTAFFSPHAAGKSVMFLLAIGHPFKRRRS